jgi:hypothetical protein
MIVNGAYHPIMSPVGAGQGGLDAGEFQQFRTFGGDRRH